MEITKVEFFSGIQVTIDREDGSSEYYQRYSPTCWEENFGDSWEEILDDKKCEKLEKLYQKFIGGK